MSDELHCTFIIHHSSFILSARRPLSKRILQVIRRLHLYAGLFMIPWVALYAFTGFLFNHGLWLPEHPSTSFGPEVTRGTPLEGLTDAATLADEVTAALRDRARRDGRPANLRLVEPERATFEGDNLGAAKSVVEADIETQTVTISGKVTGNISAKEKVEIRTDGKMTGDIKAPRILVQEGAVIEGRCEMTRAPSHPAR